MNKTEQNIDSCTFTKTILMLLVVLYHSAVFWTNRWFMPGSVKYESNSLSSWSLWLNSFHVYAFALVSGYIFYYSKFELDKYQTFVVFIENKARRLLIPYICIAIIWIIPISIILKVYTVEEIVENFILGINPSQLWFLLMLFWIFTIFWPLSKYFKKSNIAGFILVFGLNLLGCYLSGKLPNLYCIFTGIQYFLYFWIGFKIRQYQSIWNEWSRLISTICGLVNIVGYFLSNKINVDYKYQLLINIILHITGSIAAFGLLEIIGLKLKWRNYWFFGILAKNFMPIYLFHQQIIYFLILLFNGKINAYLNVLLNFLISIIVSLILSKVFSACRPLRICIGENKQANNNIPAKEK